MITYKELMEKKWVPVGNRYYESSKNKLLEGKIDFSHWCKLMRTFKLVKFTMHCGMQHKNIDLTVGKAIELMLTEERSIYYPYWLDAMIKEYGYGECYSFHFPGFAIEDELLYLCNYNTAKGYDLSTEDGKLEASIRKEQIEKYDPACENGSERALCKRINTNLEEWIVSRGWIASPVGHKVKKEDLDLLNCKKRPDADRDKALKKRLDKIHAEAFSPDMIFEILDRCEYLQNRLETVFAVILFNIYVDE